MSEELFSPLPSSSPNGTICVFQEFISFLSYSCVFHVVVVTVASSSGFSSLPFKVINRKATIDFDLFVSSFTFLLFLSFSRSVSLFLPSSPFHSFDASKIGLDHLSKRVSKRFIKREIKWSIQNTRNRYNKKKRKKWKKTEMNKNFYNFNRKKNFAENWFDESGKRWKALNSKDDTRNPFRLVEKWDSCRQKNQLDFHCKLEKKAKRVSNIPLMIVHTVRCDATIKIQYWIEQEETKRNRNKTNGMKDLCLWCCAYRRI